METGNQLVLFRDRAGDRRTNVGVMDGTGRILALGLDSISEAMRLRAAEFGAILASAHTRRQTDRSKVDLLPPIDGRMEVWGAGVTYGVSRDARRDESRDRSCYERVYNAERPELFFKSSAWRVVSDGEYIGVRDDSTSTIPEPELSILVNAYGEVLALGVCNDLTSRSIEGDNPLYLPQAKIFNGSCAISSAYTVLDGVVSRATPITCVVRRGDHEVWRAATSTAELRRSLTDLACWLFRSQRFPDGVLLATGTGIVPPPDFNLQYGDEVTIVIRGVGELRNVVASSAAVFDTLHAQKRPTIAG